MAFSKFNRLGGIGNDDCSMRTRVRGRRNVGQSLLEFAITIPFLLLLLVVIFDLGRATFYYSSITNSAREGARYGIINPANTIGIKNRVKAYSFGVDPTTLVIQVSINEAENTITVNVSYKFLPATPLISPLISGNDGITFQSETTMEIEG